MSWKIYFTVIGELTQCFMKAAKLAAMLNFTRKRRQHSKQVCVCQSLCSTCEEDGFISSNTHPHTSTQKQDNFFTSLQHTKRWPHCSSSQTKGKKITLYPEKGAFFVYFALVHYCLSPKTNLCQPAASQKDMEGQQLWCLVNKEAG